MSPANLARLETAIREAIARGWRTSYPQGLLCLTAPSSDAEHETPERNRVRREGVGAYPFAAYRRLKRISFTAGGTGFASEGHAPWEEERPRKVSLAGALEFLASE